MEPENPKMRLNQRVTPAAGLDQTKLGLQQPAGLQFASVEDMLRHDREATPVPDALAERLDSSITKLPPPAPWWKRLLSGD